MGQYENTAIPYELTQRAEITEDMRTVLDATDAGLTEREMAELLHLSKTKVHRLKNQGTARRYGFGQELGELNRGCRGSNGLDDRPPVATIDPQAVDHLDSAKVAIM